jgi:hypothetical protein
MRILALVDLRVSCSYFIDFLETAPSINTGKVYGPYASGLHTLGCPYAFYRLSVYEQAQRVVYRLMFGKNPCYPTIFFYLIESHAVVLCV